MSSELLDKILASTEHKEALEAWRARAVTDQVHMGALIPHLYALDPDTTFMCYREFKPLRDAIEFTIFYREPGKDKMRIDAEIDADSFDDDGTIDPRKVRITQWYSATKAAL